MLLRRLHLLLRRLLQLTNYCLKLLRLHRRHRRLLQLLLPNLLRLLPQQRSNH
jgi:hypothetical protein